MDITKIISAPIKIIGSLFILVFVLAFGLYFSLLNGVKFDNLSFANLEISQLYLKLDKKFYLTIDSIEDISSKDSTFDIKINENTVNLAQKILDEFHFIDIKKIKTKYFLGSLRLDKNSVLIKSDLFDLNTSFYRNNSIYEFNVHKFNFPTKNFSAVGKLKNDIRSKDIEGALKVTYFNLKSNINFKKQDNLVALNGTTNKISDLLILNKFFEVDKDLDEWLFKRLSAKDFSAKISCIYDLDKNKINLETLKVDAIANNPKIKFNDKLGEFVTSKTFVTISSSNLVLKFENPRYLSKNLDSSSFEIKDMFTKPKMSINIQHKGVFDSQIIELLRTYDVNVSEIYQTKGVAMTSVDLFFNLFDDSKMIAKANSYVENGQFSVFGKVLDISNMQFVYDDDIYLKNTDFKYENVDVKLNNFMFVLDSKKINFDAEVNTQKYKKIKINAIADSNSKEIYGKVLIPKIDFGDLLVLGDRNFDFEANVKNGFAANIKELDMQIFTKNNQTEIEFFSLKEISKYSKYAQKFKISDGNLKLTTANFDDYKFEALVQKPEVQFEISYKNRTLDKFNLFGEYKNSILVINDKLGLVKLRKDDEMKLDIKNITVSQIDEVDYRGKIKEAKKNRTIYEVLSTGLDLPKMKISATNCKFKNFVDYKIDFDTVNISMNGDSLAFDGDLGLSKVSFKKFGDSVYFSGIKITDKLLNLILGTNKFSNGYVSFKLSGDSKNLEGFVDMYNMDLIGIPIVSDIKKGSSKVKFDTQKEIINFEDVKTTGDVVDLEGFCIIYLKDKTVKSDSNIIFARNISTAISYLPLIGYIIFGDDPRIKMQATISGSVHNPKVETHFVKGTTLGVASILERILMLPIDVVGGVGKAVIGDKK